MAEVHFEDHDSVSSSDESDYNRIEDPSSKATKFDYFCVLDFEAVFHNERYEVTDFPTLLLDSNGEIVSTFHQFVRPMVTDATVVDSYVKNKYGRMGLAEVIISLIRNFSDFS